MYRVLKHSATYKIKFISKDFSKILVYFSRSLRTSFTYISTQNFMKCVVIFPKIENN